MLRTQLLKANEYARRNRRKRSWQRIVRFMACVVVFCTTYALILPAITLEYADICQKEEHIHTIECYNQITSRQVTSLECTYESLGVHKHRESCYNGGDLICNQVDFVVHSHNSSCYDEKGAKICALPEVKVHRHEGTCYQIPEAEPPAVHTHSDDCYEWLKGEKLLCSESTEGHSHDDSCYTIAEAPLCNQEEIAEHKHSEACTEKNLTCSKSTDPHVHDGACFTTEKTIICELEEIDHTHTEDCYAETQVNLCGLEEGSSHIHTEECYQMVLTCTLPETEGHAHTTACYKERTCGKEEFAGHQHTDACYEQVRGELICEIPVETEPTEPPVPVLICEKDEIILHEHKGTCYTYVDGTDEKIRICEKTVILEHPHTAECFLTETIPVDTESLTCGQEESETHAHTPLCYGTWELVCEQEEHSHTEKCRILTEEEKSQIQRAEEAIAALPEVDAISEEMAALTAARDLTGWETALQELQIKLQEARSLYEAVPEVLRPVAANDEKLLAMEEMLLMLTPPTMTEEEKAAVDAITAQIEALPMTQDVQAQLAAQPAGREGLLAELTAQVQDIRTQYEGLNDLQQRSVANVDRLTALEALLETEQKKDFAYYCGKEVHTHDESCYDAAGMLTCTLEEHIHNDLCITPLTEEEQMQVDDVIFLIDMLPAVEELEFNFADLEAAGELEELAAYREKILSSVCAAFDAYDTLMPLQKLAVTNAEKLMQYQFLLDSKPLQGSTFTVSTGDGSITANVVTETILPEGTTFQLSLVADPANATTQANAFLEGLGSELLDMLVLDMHFADAEGNKYQAEGKTEVTLHFADTRFLLDGDICALHILESGTEDVLEEAERTESGITRIIIETESFSQFLFGLTRQIPGKSLHISVDHQIDEAATEKEIGNFETTQYIFRIPGFENQSLPVNGTSEQPQNITLDENGCFMLKAGQSIVLEDIDDYFTEKQLVIGLIPQESAYLYHAAINDVAIDNPETVTLSGVVYLTYQTEIDLTGEETAYAANYHYTIDVSRMGLMEISNILIGTKPASEILFPVQVMLDNHPVEEGTKFLVLEQTDEETQQYLTADGNGVINLKAPQTVRMTEHIKPGTTYAAQLFQPVENWLMTYSGTEKTPMNIGSIEEGGTSVITLYSGPAASEAEIPVMVQFLDLAADDQLERTSTIKVTQVKDSSGTILAEQDPKIPEELPDTVLTCIGSEPQIGKLTIGYAEETEPGVFYYQIIQSEIAEVAAIEGWGNISTPDISVYIAEVTVGTTEEGIPSASVTGLWKNGEQVSKVEEETLTVEFWNQWVVYELPKTGGNGTSTYLFSGWVAIICGFALMNIKRKSRKGAE